MYFSLVFALTYSTGIDIPLVGDIQIYSDHVICIVSILRQTRVPFSLCLYHQSIDLADRCIMYKQGVCIDIIWEGIRFWLLSTSTKAIFSSGLS